MSLSENTANYHRKSMNMNEWQSDPLGMVQEIKFHHTKNRYMHKPTYVLDNDTNELLLDFDIPTDNLISPRWPDLLIINKKRKKIKGENL